MTKKELELLRGNKSNHLNTVRVHDMAIACNIAEENGGGAINYLTAGYVLGYERATRHMKNQQRAKKKST